MGNPFRWWWSRSVQRASSPWTNLLTAIACTALGVGYLLKGSWATIGYLWIGSGALALCLALAALAYRRRHPLPPRGHWHDNLFG
jgi:hypothetical protein